MAAKSSILEVTNDMIDLQIALSNLINAAEQVSAGILTLIDVCNINKRPNPQKIIEFLDLMQVYGALAD